ncbi:unnamed protein product [Rhodiola kirilowii]
MKSLRKYSAVLPSVLRRAATGRVKIGGYMNSKLVAT